MEGGWISEAAGGVEGWVAGHELLTQLPSTLTSFIVVYPHSGLHSVARLTSPTLQNRKQRVSKVKCLAAHTGSIWSIGVSLESLFLMVCVRVCVS